MFDTVLANPAIPEETRLQALNGRALVALAMGDLDGAEAMLKIAETRARENWPAILAATLANQARLSLRREHHREAISRAREALAIDRNLHHPPAIAADHVLLAEVLQELGNPEDARAHLERAEMLYGYTGQGGERTRVRATRAASR